jgi:hypothetical protein
MAASLGSRQAPPVFTMTLLAGCEPVAPDVTGYTKEPLKASTASAGSGLDQNQRLVQDLDIPGQWWATFHSRPLNDLIEDPGQLRARRRLMLRPYDTKCPIKYQLLQ